MSLLQVVEAGFGYEKQEIFNYEYGITFTEIKDSNREDIIRFIFREQRRMRQKGLI